MSERGRAFRKVGRHGQTLVEFSVVTLMTILMLLFIVEMARMVLVYTTIANAARAGARYAIVHGSTRPGGAAAADNPSGPANDPAAVLAVVTNFASVGLLATSRLVIHVTYPDASNAPGKHVNVTVVYPYDPLTTYFSSTLRLGSAAQGIIVF